MPQYNALSEQESSDNEEYKSSFQNLSKSRQFIEINSPIVSKNNKSFLLQEKSREEEPALLQENNICLSKEMF